MIQVEDYEQVRRAFFIENKSLRQIEQEFGHCRRTIKKALASPEPPGYTLTVPRAAPKLGPFKEQVDRLLDENETLPRKQRYTAHQIYKQLQAAGYTGSESSVQSYVAQRRKDQRRPAIYLPLEFDPGVDAQVDWGEAEAILGGERLTAQLFVARLNYSRRLFVRAYPTQRQEAFFEGHGLAFHHWGGVPERISYDNLTVAVRRVLEGHTREEQKAFVVFRSYYLFASHFCTPGQGHEKGGVESAVGYVRRNFLTPPPQVADFEALNALLLSACLEDDARRVDRQPLTIGEAWALERPKLRPLPRHDYACCVTIPVTLNPYGQVAFETNRYSVPADRARRQLILKAYPFWIEISNGDECLARHPRCYGHKQDIFDPLHYLPLLEERPGAFEHARPMRQWRAVWPPAYEELLARLTAQGDKNGEITREFVRILSLHRDYPAELVEQAITQALAYGCPHLEGVRLCLHHLQSPDPQPAALDLSTRPELAEVGNQPIVLAAYEQLLTEVAP
jgi:transposase